MFSKIVGYCPICNELTEVYYTGYGYSCSLCNADIEIEDLEFREEI